MSFPIAFPHNFDHGDVARSRTALMEVPRRREPGDRLARTAGRDAPTALAPGRATVDRWMAAGHWFDFSRDGELPGHWSAGPGDTRCENCGAPASSLCSMACPDRRLTSTRQRFAVHVPCEWHEGDSATAGRATCPHCNDGLVTVAWATDEFGPLRVVGHRYRLRRSKPNQFQLSDGSYHDVTPDIEPICLPGRWARGGSIEAVPEPVRLKSV